MSTSRAAWCCAGLLLSLGLGGAAAGADEADLILHHGKVVTVDRDFSVRQALAVKGDRLLRVGTDEEVLKTRGPRTALVDLGGKMVLPGLIDSHTHPTGACMTEFDHPIPEMETIRDVLDYVRSRAEALGAGKWVVVRQVFITRLKEQRYPTREELDRAAPENPVLFSTGPDASLNSLALKLSGIDKDFRPEGPGKVEKDPRTGEPTGILRNLTRYVKVDSAERKPTEQDQDRRLLELFQDYNSVGITAVIDRDASDRRDRPLPAAARGRRPDGPPRDLAARRQPGPARQDPRGDPPDGRAPAPQGRAEAPDRRDQDLPRRRHAHRQRLHARALGGEQDLRDRRPGLSRRAVHPPGAAGADGAGRRRVGPAVHRPQRRRRRRACPARRLRGGQRADAGRPDPAVHHPLELHEPRGDREGRAAGGRGRHPAGLALPRHADARRPVRPRPAAVLPAAAAASSRPG